MDILDKMVAIVIVLMTCIGGYVVLNPTPPDPNYPKTFHYTVISKRIYEYSRTTYVMVGKVMVPITSYYTDYIMVLDDYTEEEVTSKFYWSINIGTKVMAVVTKDAYGEHWEWTIEGKA